MRVARDVFLIISVFPVKVLGVGTHRLLWRRALYVEAFPNWFFSDTWPTLF